MNGQTNGTAQTADTTTTYAEPPTLPIRRPGQSNITALFGRGRHHYHGGAAQKTVAQLRGKPVGSSYGEATR